MWNKLGQIQMYGLMLAITIVIVALALAPSVVEFTEDARNATSGDTIGMDCSNSSISSFDKAACIATDLYGFYFIGTLIFIGGAIVVAKIVFDG